MGKLSTHVLDTSRGTPAAGMKVDLWRLPSAAPIRSVTTNAGGRTDAPLLEGAELAAGTYQLLFHVKDYFQARGERDAGRFLDEVPVVFVVEDPAASYHVPLLVSPWSYSTYRGS
ncbi:MAG TPA: hydroxyisourate hydrolase [Spirochaetia bacterium]|nr:hydroxyisourate hydrolase [Spirochaetia bacterium]